MQVKQMPNEVSLKFNLEELGFIRYSMKKVIEDLDKKIHSDVHEILFHSFEKFEKENLKPVSRGRPPAKKTSKK
jgi:hypothetical protein